MAQQIPEAVSWCVAHGAMYALPAADMEALGESYVKGGAFAHAPFALAPFPWPRREFEKVKRLQPTLNRVVDRVSRDGAWLETTLAETVRSDAFTARLWRVYKECPNPQSLRLGLLRSDYMLDQKKDDEQARSLQVEINTIASSFGCLSQTISELHAFLAAKKSDSSEVEPNDAGRGLARGIAAAHEAFLAQRSLTKATAVMVVQPNERNQMDQRKLEHWLWEDAKVPMKRMTLAEIADNDGLDAVDGLPVSVCYFRAGYGPGDYPSDSEWRARELIERSHAVKCPSASYQLVGTKKVQQALAAPGALERFLHDSDASSSEDVRSLFAGLFDLDEAAAGAEKAVAKALETPHAYVLKPQREGGGNNLYDDDLVAALKTMTPAERASFILMERIVSKPKPGTLVRNAHPLSGDCVAELGVYGAFLADDQQERLNAVTGHLLRQKITGTNEGGVAAGFAVLSSPLLLDDD